VAVVDLTYSPTLPAAALSFVTVPKIPSVAVLVKLKFPFRVIRVMDSVFAQERFPDPSF
jgi:hypothetical protein